MYDIPHLIKSIRNNLIKYDISTNNGTASWSIVRELYELEKYKTTKLCPKLTMRHVYPNSFEKMRVRLSTQVFSRSCSAAIKKTTDYFKMFSEATSNLALPTALFLEKIDSVFDGLNGKYFKHKNKYLCSLQSKNLYI